MATTYRTYKFDLFQLSGSDIRKQEINLEKIISRIEEYEATESTEGSIHFLKPLSKSYGFLMGTFGHNQMTGIPQKMNDETGKIEKLDLIDKEGLAHFTSFLFDPSLSMIAYESSQKGTSINGFIRFLEKNNPEIKISSSIVLNPEDLEKVRRLTKLKRFRVKIAKVQSGGVFGSKRTAVSTIAILGDRSNTETLELDLSMSFSKDSLDKDEILPMITDLAEIGLDGGVQSLYIKGEDPEDEGRMAELELIKNRVVLKIRMIRPRFDTNTSEKIGRLYDEYQKIKPKLDQAYRK